MYLQSWIEEQGAYNYFNAELWQPEFRQVDSFAFDSASVFEAPAIDGPLYTLIPGDITTTSAIAVNTQLVETLEVSGDQDWFEITLTAGQSYDVSLLGTGGSPLSDPLVRILDASGVELAQNDDIAGSIRNSLLTYTASTTGTYYISAQAYSSQTGEYTLSVTDRASGDVAQNNTTTAMAVINGSVSGTMDTATDVDWFAITLTAGQRYQITQDGAGASVLSNPYLSLLDASGAVLEFDDNSGTGNGAKIAYTALTTGTYYIAADSVNATGDYAVTVKEVPALIERTIDGIAHFLTDEFSSRTAYGTTTIYYDISGLSAGRQALALRALTAWSEVTPLIFVESSAANPAQITMDDTNSGAYNSNTSTGGVITSSTLNIHPTWYGSSNAVDGYAYQTFIHEIGHSLGLGHGGPYNGSATYGVDNAYSNDSWAYTVMSYFDQVESGYFGDYRFVLGPQIADIVAIQDLYGVNTTTRGGDTVYGYNSTETDVHDFSQFTRAPSLSIWDTGGIDTLDFSGYSQTQLIDLNAEAFSDINGISHVISIARGVLIENAIGGSGIDTIVGNAASNTLTGNGGNDILDGGAGVDYALYSGVQASYTITDNGDGTWTISHNGGGVDGTDTLSNIEIATFADGNVTLAPTGGIVFTEGNDTESGTAGDDILNALGGNDIVHGGDGNDTVLGGAGNDQLYGDAGDDTLNGGAGSDTLFGGAGADTNNGGLGFDTLDYRAAGSRVAFGLDTVGTVGDAAGDTYSGIERVYGSDFNDTITGSSGNDFIYGEAGNDVLNGGDGIDRIYGGDGDDVQRGQGGNDTLYGSAGADQLNGGGGVDSARYSNASSAVTVNLATGGTLGDAAGDTYFGIEAVYGSSFGDSLTGSSGVNELRGEDGDDMLFGGAGNDRLFGGAGADAINGGTGIDTAYYTAASAGVTLDLASGGTGGEAAGDTFTSIEWVRGSAYGDAITGDALANSLFGNAGNDTLSGAGGNDRLYGGDGDDTINGGDGLDFLYGQAGSDTLNGNAGNDFIFGSAGADAIDGGADYDTVSYLASASAVTINLQTGGTGGDANGDTYTNIERLFATRYDDTILGSDGADLILGLGGNDVIGGGLGADRLFGGAGDDAFIYDTTQDGADLIYDFRAGSLGNEIIHIQGGDTAFDTFAEVMAVATQVGAHVRFNFGGGNLLTLVNLDITKLEAADFDFNVPLAEQPDSKNAVAEDLGIADTSQDLIADFLKVIPVLEHEAFEYVADNGILAMSPDVDGLWDIG